MRSSWLLMILAACASAPSPAPLAGAAPSGAAVKPDTARAIDACVAAQDGDRDDTTCAALFAEPTCGAAWRRAGKDPFAGDSAEAIAACRAAYCPLVDDAAVCRGGALDGRGWAELMGRALLRDLGQGQAERVARAALARAQRRLEAPVELTAMARRPATHCPVSAAVVASATAIGAVVDDGLGGTRTIARCGAAMDHDALVRELRAAHVATCQDAIAIAGEPSLPYADLVAVMDAAGEAGFSQLAVVTLPSTSPPARLVPAMCPAAGHAAAAPGGAPGRPAATRPPARPAVPSDPPIVIVSRVELVVDGVVIAQVAKLPPSGTVPALTQALAVHHGPTIIIQADADAPVGAVTRVLETGKAAGFGETLFAVRSAP